MIIQLRSNLIEVEDMYDLNFEEAMAKLESGQAVKLPEWHGCWFKKDGKILVETRNGDIVDTPYLDSYKDRKDWMVTDISRDWQGIQYCLDAGKMVRRLDWPIDQFLFMRPKSDLSPEIIAKLNTVSEDVRQALLAQGREITFSAYYCLWNGGYVQNGWLPNSYDLMLGCWQVVPN